MSSELRRMPYIAHQILTHCAYSHQQVDSTENQQLAVPHHTGPQIEDHESEPEWEHHFVPSEFRRRRLQAEFEHHYSPSQFEILYARENFESPPPSHHHTQSQPSPHTPGQVEPFNHGRRRNFDEFADGEHVELNRVHQPLIIPGRIYVPPMDLRNLTPEEAHAVRQNVLELRRRNLDAEIYGNANQYETKGQEWQPYLLQRLLLVGVGIAIVTTAFFYGIFHGAVKSGKFAYRNRRQIHGTFTLIIESTYNAAKRRLITVSAPIPVAQRIRPNLRPPSPRRRNGVIRQPPMTSNRVRWEDELRARREELPMVMHGVESDAADISNYMMSGAIMDLAEEDCINPHYDPSYTPLSIDTTALDACVRDAAHPNPPLVSFATNRNDDGDGDSCMSNPEDLTVQPHPKHIRQSFVDFSPPRLVENYDSGSKNQSASASGPGSANIALLNNPNAIASSSSEVTTSRPADNSTPLSSDTDSSSSAPITATGAIDSDASSFSEPPAVPTMPKPHQLSFGSANHESITSTRVDDIYFGLSDDTEKRELPLAEFEDDPKEDMAMEIYRATHVDMELDMDSSIASDEGTGIPSAQAETWVSVASTTLPEAVLASNTTTPRERKELQVSHTSGTVPVEVHGEQIPRPITVHPVQNESHHTFSISATTPMQIQDQQGTSLPGSFIEDEGVQSSLFTSSHSEITEWQTSSANSIANSSQHDISFLTFTPTHAFEQENFPLSSAQLDGSIPISSAQILEQQSSKPTTPTKSYGQQSSLLLASPMRLPDQQSSPLSSARSDISLPVTSVPNRKTPSPQSKISTPKRIAKKSVNFFHSPRTGRPITKIKKYILGESMDFPVSSSPAPNSAASTESSILEFDSPTTIAETEALVLSFAQQEPSTPVSPHYFIKKVAPKEESEPEIVCQTSETPELAGSSTIDISNDEEVMLEVTSPMADSLEADKSVLETQSSKTTADSSSIEADKPAVAEASSAGSRPIEADKSTAENIDTVKTEGSSVVGANELVIETESSEMTADSSSKEADKPATGEGSPAGSLIGADKSTTAEVDTTMTDGSSLVRADKPVIGKEFTQETAGSSVSEADKPAVEEDVATDRDEAIATTSGKGSSKPLHDTLKLAKPELSRRKSSPNRHSIQPARKSLRLQNKSARISPPRPTKLAEKLTILDLSGGYGTTAKTSKQQKRVLKAEHTRAKQAAIEAAEEARRVKEVAEEKARKEAEEADEKARVAKEEAEEKARKEQEEEEERQRKPTRRIPKEKVIQPLTAEWEGIVKAAMDTPDMRTVLVTLPSGTTLTRKDFGTLKVVPGRDPSHGWLNDEIILASLQQVVEYGLRMSNHETGKTPKYHAFNTFFYKNLRDKGAQSIKRWATKAKIGGRALEEVERVFIPVHQGAHWTLLVVSPVARTIEYFDSMGGVADSYIRNVKLWLAAEMGARFKENEWAVPTGTHGVGPRQTNGSDCGVFTCTTARMVALGVDPMAYGGEDMSVQRGRMAAELLNGGLFGDFDPSVEF